MTQRIFLLLFLIVIGIISFLLLLIRTDNQGTITTKSINNPAPPIVYGKVQSIRMPIQTKVQKKEGAEIPKESPTKIQQQEMPASNVILEEINDKKVAQDDPILIAKIIDIFLKPPSTKPYTLKEPQKSDPSMGQSKEIRKILGDQKNGFFIECGALDGETRSNTLVFEKELGWSGLLIEGDPKNFQLVQKKNRKAWSINTCLSSKPYPNTVLFEQHFNIGKISKLSPSSNKKGYTQVQCLPLFSILLAMNITTVDYFSLDVEGLELEVLETIPWDHVKIRTLSVEFQHGKGGKYSLVNYMLQKGYYVYSDVTHPGKLANDFIFYRNDVVPNKAP
ncbi:unnamed protein product [Meganyctiphanes norvegica]|uniref:Methyltransferase FkbM domain-containing protein n=1 Tax=Meganyctiphanes norvegica TaxID=48144 RepID=A0AAV2RJE6_MEGNR